MREPDRRGKGRWPARPCCRRGPLGSAGGGGAGSAGPLCQRGSPNPPPTRGPGEGMQGPPCSGTVRGAGSAVGLAGESRAEGPLGAGVGAVGAQRWSGPAEACLLWEEGREGKVGCTLAAVGNLPACSWRGLHRSERSSVAPGPLGLLLRRQPPSNAVLCGSRVFSWGMLVLICIFPTLNFFFFLGETSVFPYW